jgi:PelA/Pel-15E family pectate lyase
MKRSIILVVALCCLLPGLKAATVLADSWSNVVNGKCSDQTTAWWSSAEAIRIVENVLLYQKDCGGFGKNINMQLVLTDAQKAALLVDKPKNTDCCIDNGALTYEILYLSKVYKAVSNDTLKTRIKNAFVKSILYLEKAQYANGGWPQYYPYRGGYSNHITYNDNAMINVMEILRRIYNKDTYYSITVTDSIANVARTAFNKGVVCILKTQYVRNNRFLAWCAQHDYVTLQPVMARSYELASMSGGESSNIIKLLMSLDNPSKEIKRAIYSSVAWYDRSRIKGQRLESFTNTDGLSDLRVVSDATATDLWARFYTLADNRPFFCDRDGIVKYSLAEIGYERRNGYSWYNTNGASITTSYNTWLPKWGTTVLVSPVPNSSFTAADSIPVMALANKYTGSTLKKFDLIVDSRSPQSFTVNSIDFYLKGLTGGTHTLIVKAEYLNGRLESDTTTISVSGTTALNVMAEPEPKLTCYLTSDGIHLDLNSGEIAVAELYNLQNQLVYKTTPLQKSICIKNTLPSGLYLVRVLDKNNRPYRQKILLNH